MAFLGDFGKFFGLGSSEQVLGDVGGGVGSLFGAEGAIIGRELGKATGRATSNLAGDDNISPISTADQALEQSAVAVSQRGNVPQETSTQLGTTGFPVQTAGFGMIPSALQGLRSITPQISKFFGGTGGAVATGLGTGVAVNAFTSSGMRRAKPVLTQSRRNKARVRQLVNFMGIEGAASFLSQASGTTVTPWEGSNSRTFDSKLELLIKNSCPIYPPINTPQRIVLVADVSLVNLTNTLFL